MFRLLALREHEALTPEKADEDGQFKYRSWLEPTGAVWMQRMELDRLQADLARDMEVQGTDAPLVALGYGGTINARDRVGFVQSGNLGVEVYPKYLFPEDGPGAVLEARQKLTRLLEYCGYGGVVPGISADRSLVFESLAEWMLHGMARDLVCALRKGLAREYDAREDALYVVRGRPDVSQQVRRLPGQQIPLWCCYEEHCEESALARLLRRLVKELRWRIRYAATRDLVRRADFLLPHCPASANAVLDERAVHWSPRNRSFRPSVDALRVLLRHQAHGVQHGEGRSWSFSVGLKKLFEDYLAGVCEHLVKKSGAKVASQKRIGYLASSRSTTDAPGRAVFEQCADVVLAGAKSTSILDAKYKRSQSSGLIPDLDDVRQVLTYAALWNRRGRGPACTKVGLVFPRRWDGKPYSTRYEGFVEVDGRPVELWVVDISFGAPPRTEDDWQRLQQALQPLYPS